MNNTKQIRNLINVLLPSNYVIVKKVGRPTKMESDVLDIVKTLRQSHFKFQTIFDVLKQKGLMPYSQCNNFVRSYHNRHKLNVR